MVVFDTRAGDQHQGTPGKGNWSGGRVSRAIEAWLHNLRTRNRKPIPDSSVPSIRSALDCWLLPNLGDMPLSQVNNPILRGLVKKMMGTLSAKTINTYINIAKEIVESLLDEDGEPIHARKWNNDLIDVPIVSKREQRRPKLTKEAVTAVIVSCETDWDRMLYILCPVIGTRIAEALALEINHHISNDCTMIRVRQQVSWEALARYRDGCILVEAKSHVAEICGRGCRASKKGIVAIQLALERTKQWLGVPKETDWR